MAERHLDDELDDAVDALMNQQNLPSDLSPAVAEIVQLAEVLHDLPDADFRRALKDALFAAVPAAQPRILTGANFNEIPLALEEMVARGPFTSYDLAAALQDLPDLSMRFLAQMSTCTLGVSRVAEASHWERHPAADEMLYVIEGAMDVSSLTADGIVVEHVGQGSIFICPQGVWHRIDPLPHVSILFATPGEGTHHSEVVPDYPAGQSLAALPPVVPAKNLRDVLRQLPELKISESTTEPEAGEAFGMVAQFNDCSVAVGRFRGLTPWERHGNDELLHILDGEVDITVLTDDGPVRRHLQQGEIFVCPGGLWHCQWAPKTVTGFYATPRPSEASWADDPRVSTE